MEDEDGEAKCRHSVLRPVKLYKTQTEGSSAPSNVPYPCGEEPTESVWKVFQPIRLITARFTVLWLLAAHGKIFHVLVLMWNHDTVLRKPSLQQATTYFFSSGYCSCSFLVSFSVFFPGRLETSCFSHSYLIICKGGWQIKGSPGILRPTENSGLDGSKMDEQEGRVWSGAIQRLRKFAA